MSISVPGRAGTAPSNAFGVRRMATRFARAIDRTLFAHRIRHDLTELPDRLRRDIGLIRMALAAAIVLPVLMAGPGSALI